MRDADGLQDRPSARIAAKRIEFWRDSDRDHVAGVLVNCFLKPIECFLTLAHTGIGETNSPTRSGEKRAAIVAAKLKPWCAAQQVRKHKPGLAEL